MLQLLAPFLCRKTGTRRQWHFYGFILAFSGDSNSSVAFAMGSGKFYFEFFTTTVSKIQLPNKLNLQWERKCWIRHFRHKSLRPKAKTSISFIHIRWNTHSFGGDNIIFWSIWKIYLKPTFFGWGSFWCNCWRQKSDITQRMALHLELSANWIFLRTIAAIWWWMGMLDWKKKI